MITSISQKKKDLRKILFLKRKNIKKKTKNYFNVTLFDELRHKINFETITSVASFISIKSEFPTNDLNKHIMKMNKILSLPKIEPNTEILIFRQYQDNDELNLGKFNIPEPSIIKKKVFPELIFVPCLGFDFNGYRIGYGGGYYDKTFAHLKKNNFKFYTVGIAFDDQKIIEVPTEDFDYKLDYVLTEKKLYSFV